MDYLLQALAIAAGMGGFIAVCLRIRNKLLEARNLNIERQNLLEAANRPGPKVVQNPGRDAHYLDLSQHRSK